jgi:hypothetical protein
MAGWMYCDLFHWYEVACREWRLMRHDVPFRSESVAA